MVPRGVSELKCRLDDFLDGLLRTLTDAFDILEVQLIASVSTHGTFMGFGVGGAASMELTVCPSDDSPSGCSIHRDVKLPSAALCRRSHRPHIVNALLLNSGR